MFMFNDYFDLTDTLADTAALLDSPLSVLIEDFAQPEDARTDLSFEPPKPTHCSAPAGYLALAS